MICPIYKKGSKDDVISKVFTKALNSHLSSWAEECKFHHEEQAGFRHGYSTVDQIFILQSMVQKYLCTKRGHLYVMFEDFATAFDSIPHFSLWYRLIKLGVHSKFLQILKSMYAKLKANIRLFDGGMDFFDFV